MTDKQQELDLKQTLESLEEFFTLISFNSNYERLKILSVETVEQAAVADGIKQKATVIQLADKREALRKPSVISKALRVRDSYYHS